MADFDYDRFADIMARVLAERSRDDKKTREDEAERKQEAARIKQLNEQLKGFSATLKNNRDQWQGFTEYLKNGKTELNNVTDKLKDLDNQIDSVTDTAEKSKLKEQKRDIERQAGWENTKRSAANFASTMVTSGYTVAKELATATKDIVNSMMTSGSDTKMFTGIFSAGIKVLSSGATALGSIFGGLGSAVGALASIKFPLLGKVISGITGGLGAAFGKIVSIAGGALAGALELMVSQLDGYIKSFNRMNTSGAAFAGGMGEMIRTANRAGLTIEQFSNVINKNSEAIANAGLGMTDGSKKLSKAMAAGGAELQRQLFNLGYNVEEQGGLFAETMKMMTSTAGPLKASDREVAEQTKKYAENLRFLSAITGEDAKKRIAETRKNLDNLLMQRKMQDMSGTQLATFQNALSRVPPELQRMLIQQSEYGTVFSQDLAIMKNQSPALQNFIAELTGAFKTGTLNQEQVNAALEKYTPAMKTELPRSLALAIAAYKDNSSVAGQAANAMSNVLKVLQPIPENLNEIDKNLEKSAQADKTDPLTNLMTTVQQEAQKLRVLVESTIAGLLNKFGDVLAEGATKIAENITKIVEALSMGDFKGVLSSLLETLTSLIPGFGNLKEALQKIDTKEAGKVAGEVTGAGVGGYIGYKVGGALGKKLMETILGGAGGAGAAAPPAANLGKPDGTAQNPFHVVVLGNIGGAVTGTPGTPGQPKTPTGPGTPQPNQPKGGAGTPQPAQPATPKGGVGGGAKYYGKLAGGLIGKIGGLFGGGMIGSMIVGKLGEIAGEKLGELIESVYSSVMSGEAGIEGKASGGLVKGGTPYVVGELGPELFVPKSTGAIVPNSLLESLSGMDSNKQQGIDTLSAQLKSLTDTLSRATSGSTPALQPELKNIMTEQSMLYQTAVQQQEEMIRVLGDLRNIQQQILNNT